MNDGMSLRGPNKLHTLIQLCRELIVFEGLDAAGTKRRHDLEVDRSGSTAPEG